MKTNFPIPEEILICLDKLKSRNFEVFLVGGCVRDLLSNKNPKDWDIATSALPEQTLEIFPQGRYENNFGTVVIAGKYLVENPTQENVEITTFRTEKNYQDSRHPEEVNFVKTLAEDLSRRDFTVNAMAIEIKNEKLKVKNVGARPCVRPDKNQESGIRNQENERGDSKYQIENNFQETVPSTRNKRQTKTKTRDSRNVKVKNFPSNNKCHTCHSRESWNPAKINATKQKNNWIPAYAGMTDTANQTTKLVDLFGGQEDLKNRIIRAVGDPMERFNEDALRMMRAVRFAVQLGFKIEEQTQQAIIHNHQNLRFIAKERIKDELEKILLSPSPAQGIRLLVDLNLAEFVFPELLDTIGVGQNKHHRFTVYEHLIKSLEKCQSGKLEVRLAALFHDIGKPQTKRGSGESATFHNHEFLSEKIALRILSRLRFPVKVVEKTVLLIRNHMFFYDVDRVGEAGVRRLICKVGLENMRDLLEVRIADRLGSGVPKAVPYKLRHFQFMVEKVSADPISVKQLKLNGDEIIAHFKIAPSPIFGAILEILLARVIENPSLNKRETLIQMTGELLTKDLVDLRAMAKEKIKEKKSQEETQKKKKYWIK